MIDRVSPERRAGNPFGRLVRSKLATHLGLRGEAFARRFIVDLECGVDGVINEGVLGLDIICMQAKWYAVGNGFGVDKIRDCAGALDERGATMGVFVTTSHFAPQALLYAARSPKWLILIDWDELTRLLVKSDVAGRRYGTLEIKKLDADFFEELDS